MKILNMYKKFKKGDLSELIKRVEQINEYVYVVQSLNTAKAIWVNSKIKELGLDLDKQYNIDFKTGRIIPVSVPEESNIPPYKPTKEEKK